MRFPSVLSVLCLTAALSTALAASPVHTSGHALTLDLISGQGGANGGLNFNGGFKGSKTFTVPLGSVVTVNFQNMGTLTHSFVIRKGGAIPTDADATDAAFPAAYAPMKVEAGLKTGMTQKVTFTANKAGAYSIVCLIYRYICRSSDIHRVAERASHADLGR
jgi:plastocyanin